MWLVPEMVLFWSRQGVSNVISSIVVTLQNMHCSVVYTQVGQLIA